MAIKQTLMALAGLQVAAGYHGSPGAAPVQLRFK